MVEHRAVVAADIFHRHVARPLGALVDEGPAGRDRLRRVGPVDLAVELVVLGELLLDLAPRLLRDDQQPDAELGHDARALGTHRRGIGAAAEGFVRGGADGGGRLLVMLAVIFHHAGLEAAQQRLAVFDEQLAAVAHVEPEAVELDLAGAAAQTQDHAAAREMVEHRDLLGHAHRVVPRQHHHHRAQPHMPGAAGHVGEELHDVGTHRVVGEVVLDRPDRVRSPAARPCRPARARSDRSDDRKARGRCSGRRQPFPHASAVPPCRCRHGKRPFTCLGSGQCDAFTVSPPRIPLPR